MKKESNIQYPVINHNGKEYEKKKKEKEKESKEKV